MHTLVKVILILLVALIGYFFPQKYNDYFYGKYHDKVVSMPFAVAAAAVATVFLFLMEEGGFWYWIFLIAFAFLCLILVALPIYKGVSTGASVLEIVVAVLAQLAATAGVLIVILFIIAMLMNRGKKRR